MICVGACLKLGCLNTSETDVCRCANFVGIICVGV